MARQPKLRKKTVRGYDYWFTKAGTATYFGRVDQVSHKDAKKAFAAHLVTIRAEEAESNRKGLSVGELADSFLEWIQKHRSDSTYETRQRYCERFARFKVGPKKTQIGRLLATQMRGEYLEEWLASEELKDLEFQTQLHAETSVRACFNWGTKHPSPTPYLPRVFRPFSAVERTRVPPKALTEADLITNQEVQAIFEAARLDPDQFRRHGLEKTVAKRGTSGLRQIMGTDGNFADLLACYYATGARTSELIECRVADVQFGSKQLLLGKHKQLRTQKDPRSRQVTLNSEAMAIFTRHCNGKSRTDHVFAHAQGQHWTRHSVAKRFTRTKEIAVALKQGIVREQITIYAFRHLWISESMQVNDVPLVAKMAGTSTAMIEKVYGHFRNKTLHNAQHKLDELRKEAIKSIPNPSG